MKKKLPIALAVIALLLTSGIYLLFPFYFNGMYWACKEVETGMSKNKVEEIMKSYNSDLYQYTRGDVKDSGRMWDREADVIHTYIWKTFSCSIFIKDDAVISVDRPIVFF